MTKNSEFKIEKNVSVRPRGRYPFGEMEVGDSFLVPPRLAKQVEKAAWNYGSRHNKRFCTRIQPDGSRRIWRIE